MNSGANRQVQAWGDSDSTPCYGFSTFSDASDFPGTKGKRLRNFSSIAITWVRFYHRSWIFRVYPRQNPTLSAIPLFCSELEFFLNSNPKKSPELRISQPGDSYGS